MLVGFAYHPSKWLCKIREKLLHSLRGSREQLLHSLCGSSIHHTSHCKDMRFGLWFLPLPGTVISAFIKHIPEQYANGGGLYKHSYGWRNMQLVERRLQLPKWGGELCEGGATLCCFSIALKFESLFWYLFIVLLLPFLSLIVFYCFEYDY